MMKTLLISITHGFQARDLLRTDVYRLIRRAGVRVVIATPNYKDEYFVREFGGPNVSFERLDTSLGRFEAALGAFRRYVLASFKLNQTINALNERFHKSRSPKYVAVRALNAVFGRVPLLRRLWMRLEAALFPGRHYDLLFRRYRPDLLVTGSPGTIPADTHLLRCARRFKVPSACVVLSWDNLTSKGHMGAVPDELIVWNRIMTREAVELHQYPPERVHIAGVSHFDVYARRSASSSREGFCRTLGLDPGRAVITLGTVTPWFFPYNAEIAEILARAVQESRFCRPAQLVIRVHPQVLSPGTAHSENIDQYRQLAARYEHVHLDVPSVRSESLMWDVAESDMIHLADLLRYSDVTLNAGSTLSIDSAIVDTPIVNIGFDGYHTLPAEKSVLRVYDFTHYANIVRTGGVRIARSGDEMITSINEYLRDSSLDRAGRLRIVEEQCYRVDGQSGQRVGALLLSMLGLPSAAQTGEDGSVSRHVTETSRVAHG